MGLPCLGADAELLVLISSCTLPLMEQVSLNRLGFVAEQKRHRETHVESKERLSCCIISSLAPSGIQEEVHLFPDPDSFSSQPGHLKGPAL